MPGNRSENLLVSHTEPHLGVFAIPELEHILAHHFPPARFFPEFGRLQRGQKKLLAANAVHLFADDLHYLETHSLSQREQRINSRGQLANVARANQESMACDFGIRRIFTQSGYEQIGPTHLLYPFSSWVSGRSGGARLPFDLAAERDKLATA